MSENTTTLQGRSAPHHIDAERAVLGAILRDNGQMSDVMIELREHDFYLAIHRQIYAAMLKLFSANHPIDITSLSNEISLEELDKVGGVRYLADLFDVVAPGTKPDYYAGIVREKSLRRQLITVVTDAAGEAYQSDQNVEDQIVETERRLIALTENSSTRAYEPISKLVVDAVKTIRDRFEKDIVGLDTGFVDLNDKTGGLHANELVIIAARPGMGKTSFAMNIAMNAATLTNNAVLFFSLEMGGEQLVQRVLAAECGIDQHILRKGVFSRDQFPAIFAAADRLSRAPLYIDDTPALTVAGIFSKARRLIGELRRANKQPLSLIVIDYLQLMAADRKLDRHLQISEISRGLKLLAKDLKIPIVALSQLNRGVESRSDKRPMLSDLRESGAIEQDADTIMFIYRDDVYNEQSERKNIAEIIIGKQRNGPLGTIELRFTPEFTRFDNLDKIHHVPGGIEPLP